MKEEKPNYYAVIKAEVRYCERLSPNAKLLYGEITALCNKEGFCWASNKYFADLYDVKNRTICGWIKELKDNDFISYNLKDGYRREIYIVGGGEYVRGGRNKKTGGVGINVRNNNTYNTTSNKKEKNTPTQDFFNSKDFSILENFKDIIPEKVLKEEVQKFMLYWTEKNPSGKKCKWEMQQTFDVKRRLATWLKNTEKWNYKPKILKSTKL